MVTDIGPFRGGLTAPTYTKPLKFLEHPWLCCFRPLHGLYYSLRVAPDQYALTVGSIGGVVVVEGDREALAGETERGCLCAGASPVVSPDRPSPRSAANLRVLRAIHWLRVFTMTLGTLVRGVLGGGNRSRAALKA